MKVTKPNMVHYFDVPNPGLRAYLSHVKEGNSEDYRTPFWEGSSRETILNRWHERVDALRDKMQVPGLMDYELEMKSKVGPMSVQKPLSERLDDVEQYYKLIETKSVPILSDAINLAWAAMAKSGGVRLRSLESVVDNMRLNTNSGTPYFTKRRIVADKTLETLEEVTTRAIKYGSYENILDPSHLLSDVTGSNMVVNREMVAILGWRGQEGGPADDDVKQRVVWMMPFSVNILEGMAYQPLVASWQNNKINSAYISIRAVEEKITHLFDSKGDEYVVVTDFSKFDQHFNKYLQQAAHDLISKLLVTSGSQYAYLCNAWLDNVFPYKYIVPILCSDEIIYEGRHGMASGSTGTNFDECCAHTAMQHECALLNGATLNPYSNAYGDDGYLSFRGIDVDKVISTYSSHGQEMNPDKQSCDKHSAVYLRRFFHDSYRDKNGIMLGIYSTFRALGRLLGQERYFSEDEVEDDYKSLVELRAYSILENCNKHPLFYEFIDFVMSGDRYRLGLDIPGFLDSLGNKIKKFEKTIPDLLGYTKTLQNDDFSGIENWEVVKYLKSKR